MNRYRLLFSLSLIITFGTNSNFIDDFKEGFQETLEGIKECFHVAKDEFKNLGNKIGAEIHEIKEAGVTAWNDLTKKNYDAVIVEDLELVEQAKKDGLFVARIEENGREKFVIVFNTKHKDEITHWLEQR